MIELIFNISKRPMLYFQPKIIEVLIAFLQGVQLGIKLEYGEFKKNEYDHFLSYIGEKVDSINENRETPITWIDFFRLSDKDPVDYFFEIWNHFVQSEYPNFAPSN